MGHAGATDSEGVGGGLRDGKEKGGGVGGGGGGRAGTDPCEAHETPFQRIRALKPEVFPIFRARIAAFSGRESPRFVRRKIEGVGVGGYEGKG